MPTARCLHVSRLQTLTNAIAASKASASQAALDAWCKIIAMVGGNWRPSPHREADPDLQYLRTSVRARIDPVEASERRFAELLEAQPASFHAMEEHASVLDRMGQLDAALTKYESARRGRAGNKRGMADRPFFTRHGSTSAAEIHGYTKVLRAGASQKGIYPYVARGHAYLATGRPRLALLDYDKALRLAPHETGLLVARGEALAALGRHREALQVLDQAVARRPQDPEALSSRASVLLALGRLAEADADWARQLELLPRERHAARACVLLRLANYEVALRELERAIERNPRDPYMQLYFVMSLRRLGRSVQPGFDAANTWPGRLIALHRGELSPSEVLAGADNPERRAEALFQLGVRAYHHDPAEAAALWSQAAEIAASDTIEHAAARHEIEMLRTEWQPAELRHAAEKETIMMATSK